MNWTELNVNERRSRSFFPISVFITSLCNSQDYTYDENYDYYNENYDYTDDYSQEINDY